MRDVCPHRLAPLSEGRINDQVKAHARARACASFLVVCQCFWVFVCSVIFVCVCIPFVFVCVHVDLMISVRARARVNLCAINLLFTHIYSHTRVCVHHLRNCKVCTFLSLLSEQYFSLLIFLF